jgi:hypothetical protein
MSLGGTPTTHSFPRGFRLARYVAQGRFPVAVHSKKSKRFATASICTGSHALMKMMGTETASLFLLIRRAGEGSHLKTKRAGELQTQMTQTADSDYAYFHTRTNVEYAKWRENGNASTHKWRCGFRAELFGNRHGKTAMYAQTVRQSLLSRCRSVWQMPQWVTATSTSDGPSGSGSYSKGSRFSPAAAAA